MENMPTILIDWIFCRNAKFNSVNCPAVICSRNTCYWRVTTSADSREPRSFISSSLLFNQLRTGIFSSAIASVLLLLLVCYCFSHIITASHSLVNLAPNNYMLVPHHITTAFTSPLFLVFFRVQLN